MGNRNPKHIKSVDDRKTPNMEVYEEKWQAEKDHTIDLSPEDSDAKILSPPRGQILAQNPVPKFGQFNPSDALVMAKAVTSKQLNTTMKKVWKWKWE